MPIDLSEIKSAVSVTSPDEIAATLADRDTEFQKMNRNVTHALTHTLLRETDDGMMLSKRIPCARCTTVEYTKESLQPLCEKAGVQWNDEYIKRVKSYWGSDSRTDRHGDIVEQTWNFEDFSKNPLLLHGHEWHKPPIGAVVEYGVKHRDDDDYKGEALALACLFATKDIYDFADTVFRLVDAGMMRSGSVGMYPGEIIYVEDDEERKRLGLGRWGVILRNNSLVEYSPVSVPANVGAHLRSLDRSNLRKQVKPQDFSVLREVLRLSLQASHAPTRAVRDADSQLTDFWQALFPDTKAAKLLRGGLLDDSVLTQEDETVSDRQLLKEIHRAVHKINKHLSSEKGALNRTGNTKRTNTSMLRHLKEMQSMNDR